MKKRAIVSTLASIALAGVMCVGFAACGGDTAESIKGEEVDQATWDAAFENEELYKNFKLETEGDMVMEMTLAEKTIKVTAEQSGECIYADAKTYAIVKAKTSVSGDLPDEMKDYYKDGSEEMEYYVDESGEEIKYVAKVDGKWANITENTNRYNSALEALENVLDNVVGSGEYEDYEYSAEHNGYVAKEAREGELVVIKFKDGKLKAIYTKETEESASAKTTFTMSYVITYEGQSVTVPAVGE